MQTAPRPSEKALRLHNALCRICFQTAYYRPDAESDKETE
ncbi:hypothetical protein HMPREF9120_00906 [Neisseria sp. oral taxon 020 str. F0370]|nr:hypothetical protein HMPREF9120_00906 [Neisseria sp. oral taxon 020 str. F0370]